MSYDPQSPSDRADHAPDAYDGRDWNAKLHTIGDPPKDRELYVITDDGDYQQVQWCDQTKYWTGRDAWLRTDGESGSWERDEIVGWTDSYDDAVQAAREFAEFWA